MKIALTVLAVIFIGSTTKTWSASACDNNVPTSPACCDRTGVTAQPLAAPAKLPSPTLTVNGRAQFQNFVAADVTRLTLHGNPSLLTLAATTSREGLPVKIHSKLQSTAAAESLTNDLGGIEVSVADTAGNETGPFPVEFAGQISAVIGTANRSSVRRDFNPSTDALFSGSKATGLSFAFSRSARIKLSANAKGDRATAEWRDLTAADFIQFPTGQIWGGNDANREPQGLRLFSWRW